MKRFLLLLIFLAANAYAEGNNLVGDNVSVETTGTGYGKVAVLTNANEPIEFYTNKALRGYISGAGVFTWPGTFSGMTLPNATYYKSTDAAGTGTLSLLRGDATDDTELNCKSGELIKLSENGTAGITIDPSTNGVTFASLAELGSNSTTDGISEANFSNGTGKGKAYFTGNSFTIGTVTANDLIFLSANGAEAALGTAAFYPFTSGGNALGAAANGWNGLYLSDGTDKWSLVPGTNMLRLAAGADDQQIKVAGGTAADKVNGAYFVIQGNDFGGAGAAGNVIFSMGNESNSDFYVYLNGTGSDAYYYDDAGAILWAFEQGGNLTQGANGGNIVMAKASTGMLAGSLTSVHADVTDSIGAWRGIYSFGAGSNNILARGDAGDSPAYTSMVKSRATDGSANTVLVNGDDIGTIDFWGADGALFKRAAQITAEVDGTPGINDMPGRITFWTTPDGSATPAEALRITSQGTTLVKGVAVASLPASCAPGSLIRATNSNDCSAAGGDGAMCICTAAGAWALAHNY